MNYKPPRDKNTKSGFEVPLRRMDPSQNWPCHVGSGECKEPAVEAHDDGSGGEFLVCSKHMPEVNAMGKLIEEMCPKDVQKFSTLVTQAE